LNPVRRASRPITQAQDAVRIRPTSVPGGRLSTAAIAAGKHSISPFKSTDIGTFTQDMLAEMIGTTRSRVSFFMNNFRKLGFISYDANSIEVHSPMLNAILHNKPQIRTDDL